MELGLHSPLVACSEMMEGESEGYLDDAVAKHLSNLMPSCVSREVVTPQLMSIVSACGKRSHRLIFCNVPCLG